ncbi:hypothetical protein OF83DRAFT_556483 [Amylostereum chailletii]|nr:hypothetical protein OF83DRAFT_556483 [Amylostereum chailletii]
MRSLARVFIDVSGFLFPFVSAQSNIVSVEMVLLAIFLFVGAAGVYISCNVVLVSCIACSPGLHVFQLSPRVLELAQPTWGVLLEGRCRSLVVLLVLMLLSVLCNYVYHTFWFDVCGCEA